MLPHWLLYSLPLLCGIMGWMVAQATVTLSISAVLKRKKGLGKVVGDYAAAQFSFDPIEKKLTAPESIESILPFADGHIETFLRVKLPAAMPMLAMFISDKLVADMKAIFLKELAELFPAVIQQYISGIKKDFDVSRLVAEKISDVPDALLKPVLRKALQVVTIACTFTGFLCGCFYILLTLIA